VCECAFYERERESVRTYRCVCVREGKEESVSVGRYTCVSVCEREGERE